MRTVTATWLPGRKPKATPWLRVFTSSMPGSSLCASPGVMESSTARLASWSMAITPRVTSRASSHGRAPGGTLAKSVRGIETDPRRPVAGPPARRRPRSAIGGIRGSAVDEAPDHDVVEDLKGQDGQERAEVEPPERRDHA